MVFALLSLTPSLTDVVNSAAESCGAGNLSAVWCSWHFAPSSGRVILNELKDPSKPYWITQFDSCDQTRLWEVPRSARDDKRCFMLLARFLSLRVLSAPLCAKVLRGLCHRSRCT